MKFNKLCKNILYYIGDTMVVQRQKAPFALSKLYEAFADVPRKNVEEALEFFESKDLISPS